MTLVETDMTPVTPVASMADVTAMTTVNAAVTSEVAAAGKPVVAGETMAAVAEVERAVCLASINPRELRLTVLVVSDEFDEMTRLGLVDLTNNISGLRCRLGGGRCERHS